MSKKTNPHRSTKRQAVGIVAIAIGVIGVAIVVTLLFRGDLDLSVVGLDGLGIGGSGEYRNITMTDAQVSCRDLAKSKYGKRLKYISLDGHSSRFEKDDKRFKVYFTMGLYPRLTNGRADDFYLNCFVDGSRGNVTHFEAIENRSARSTAEGEKSGLFGF